MLKQMFLFLLVLTLLTAQVAHAHSGNTDSYGCHNDNIHGGRHCHNSGNSNSTEGEDIATSIVIIGVAVIVVYWISKNTSPLPIEPLSEAGLPVKPSLHFFFLPTVDEGNIGGMFELSYPF